MKKAFDKKMKRALSLAVVAATLGAGSAQARDIFETALYRDWAPGMAGEPANVANYSFTQIEKLFESVDMDFIGQAFDGFDTDRDAVTAELFVRGLPAQAYYQQNSNDLHFVIDSLDIHVSCGETSCTDLKTGEIYSNDTGRVGREASWDQFDEYMTKNNNGMLTKMLKAMVATTGVDPVAGNPASLMSRMATTDFTSAIRMNLARAASMSTSPFGAGAAIARYTDGDNDLEQDVITIPLVYTHHLEDPRKQIMLSAPITYTDTGGATSYTASLGVGYRHPMNDDWSLIPAVRVGITGSQDMGSAGVLYSASVSSVYNIYKDDLKIQLGNMLGVFQSVALDAGDYQIDYDLSNQVTRNGVSLEGSTNFQLFGKPTSWQAAATHTYFWGDDTYIDSYFDLAFTLGSRYSEAGADWDSFRLGLTFTLGNNDYRGIGLNFGYQF